MAERSETMEEAKTMLRDAADSQRRKAAETLGSVAQVLHRTATDLDAENKTMARFTDIAAKRLDNFAQSLRQADWGDMLEDAEDFARRQPWWFVGGAVAAGFITARVIKSSGVEPMVKERFKPEPMSMAEPMGGAQAVAGDLP